MHQVFACLWDVLNWCYPLRSEKKQWRETCDMKKSTSVVTLSINVKIKYCKRSLTADRKRNIIMLLLSFICTISLIGSCRDLLSNHFSLQEVLFFPTLYKYPKNRDKTFFKGAKHSCWVLSIARFTNNFYADCLTFQSVCHVYILVVIQ